MRSRVYATPAEYLESVPSAEARAALQTLRQTIRAAAPEAEEVISYGIPIFKCHGMVAGYAAFKNHCSFFPGHTVADFAEGLRDFKVLKGTVQFTPEEPIPEALVIAMVRARMAENLDRASQSRAVP